MTTNPFLKSLQTSFVDPFKKAMSTPLPAIGGSSSVKPLTLNTNTGMVSKPPVPNMSYASPAPNMSVAPATPAVPKVTKPSDPNVLAQQKALNAKGAGLKEDGIMGPLTQAAITRFSTPTPPVTPTTADGKYINPSTGGVSDNAPVPPPAPAPVAPPVPSPYETAVTDAEKAYSTAGQMTPEEEAVQNELDRLNTSFRTGYQGIQDKVIPMEFITGQSASLEKRALNLAEPLETRLARLQAKRMSALETSKFALERADAKLKTQTDAEKEKGKLIEGTSFYDPKTGTFKTAPAKEGATPDGFSLSPGQTRFDANGNPIASVADPNAPNSAQSTAKSMDQINLVKSSLDRAKNLAGASGRSGVRKAAESWFIGSTDYTNLVAETNTLRTNVLTLMTDPAIKKFFGPQMSNADVQLMTSAGTTLNPELQSADNMISELARLEDLINRAEKAVQQGMGGGTSGGVVNTTIGPINTNW